MKNLVFIGYSNIIHIILDIIKEKNEYYDNFYIIDDNQDFWTTEKEGIKVIGGFQDIERLVDENQITHAAITISENHMNVRYEYFKGCSEKFNLKFPNFIHPKSVISSTVSIQKGIVICAGVVINPYCVLEDNLVIFTSSSIDHHSRVGNSAIIGPGVHTGGFVNINSKAFLGVGSVILPRISLGENSLIGAGAVVTKNVENNTVVAGNPAKIIRKLNN